MFQCNVYKEYLFVFFFFVFLHTMVCKHKVMVEKEAYENCSVNSAVEIIHVTLSNTPRTYNNHVAFKQTDQIKARLQKRLLQP